MPSYVWQSELLHSCDGDKRLYPFFIRRRRAEKLTGGWRRLFRLVGAQHTPKILIAIMTLAAHSLRCSRERNWSDGWAHNLQGREKPKSAVVIHEQGREVILVIRFSYNRKALTISRSNMCCNNSCYSHLTAHRLTLLPLMFESMQSYMQYKQWPFILPKNSLATNFVNIFSEF